MVSREELRASKFFDVFADDADLELIAQFSAKKHFKRGERIYQSGDLAQKFYVVTKGVVSLRELHPGDNIGIAFETRAAGEVFGVASFMLSRRYTLTCVCLEDTEVLEVDVEKLEDLTKKKPLIGYILMKEVARVYFERYKQCKRQLYNMVKAPTLITALPG